MRVGVVGLRHERVERLRVRHDRDAPRARRLVSNGVLVPLHFRRCDRIQRADERHGYLRRAAGLHVRVRVEGALDTRESSVDESGEREEVPGYTPEMHGPVGVDPRDLCGCVCRDTL